MRKFAKNSKNVKNIRMFVKKVPALPLWQGKCAWERVPTFPRFVPLWTSILQPESRSILSSSSAAVEGDASTTIKM